MIAPPPGWSAAVDDEGLTLRPSGGAGLIRYTERLRPLLPLGERVELRCRALGLDVVAVGAREELVTDEGEHAQIVALRAAGARILMGHVLVDDYFAETLAIFTADEARFAAAVRALVRTDAHGMALRRRKFRYSAPAGWEPRPSGSPLDSCWAAADGSTLAVPAAIPAAAATTGGLLTSAGLCFELSDEALDADSLRMRAVAAHGPFLYALTLDGPAAAARRNRETLQAVARSIQPIPAPVGLAGDRARPFAGQYE
jgi:hypothetical protein